MEKKNKKKLCFDLDNVICNTKSNNYKNATPNKEAIKLVNKLYSNNFEIIIFTARFMGRTNNNKEKAISLGYNLTKNQLKKWKLKYTRLLLGKPSYDLIIDDKALGFSKKNWITQIKRKYLNK